MFRNFHNSRGLSTNAGNQNPRWRRFFFALMLALAIGSMNLSASAQEAGPRYSIKTQMETSIPKDICLGEIASIKVKVVRTVNVTVPQFNVHPNFRFDRLGIPINAISADPGIASLLQTRQFTGFEYDFPGWVEFDYLGKAAGTTRIDFSTDSVSRLAGEEFDMPDTLTDSDKFKTTVPVKVLSCNFEVTTVSTFSVPNMKIVATINKALMRTDKPGHYIGTAKVTWTGSWDDFSFNTAGGGSTCRHKFEAPPSEAHLQGQLDQSGNLMMDVSYQVHSGLWSTGCGGPIASVDPVKLNPGPLLNIDVPISSGLENTLPQEIEMLGGEVLIIVVPQHTGNGQ